MSVHVSSWAWKQKLGDPGLKLVLVKLADNADDNGYSWWRQQRLADECEISKPTVQRKLAELKKRGLIEVVERRGDDGRQLANGYRIIRPSVPQSEVGGISPDEAGGTSPGDAPEPSLELSLDLKDSAPSAQEVIVRTWLESDGLIVHREPYFKTPKVKTALRNAVETYGAQDTAKAIRSYAAVLASPDHFFNYRWTLGDFLTRGLDKFVPEAEPERVFRGVRQGTSGVATTIDEDDGYTRDQHSR